MKRSIQYRSIEIVIGKGILLCTKCRHTRKDEPLAINRYYPPSGEPREEIVCWHCCRDAESTLLIQQKWPIAFERIYNTRFWYLQWSPGVKELVGKNEKA